jgi:hypothetical protein
MGTHPRNTSRSQPVKTPITFEELQAIIEQFFMVSLPPNWGFAKRQGYLFSFLVAATPR